MFTPLDLFIHSSSQGSSDQMIDVGIMAFPFRFILKNIPVQFVQLFMQNVIMYFGSVWQSPLFAHEPHFVLVSLHSALVVAAVATVVAGSRIKQQQF